MMPNSGALSASKKTIAASFEWDEMLDGGRMPLLLSSKSQTTRAPSVSVHCRSARDSQSWSAGLYRFQEGREKGWCQGRAAGGGEDSVVADVESMLSTEGRARRMAGLRKVVTAFAGVPGIIGLHGGLPPATAFPIKGVTLTLEDGQKVEIGDPVKVRIRSDTRHAEVAEQACRATRPHVRSNGKSRPSAPLVL